MTDTDNMTRKPKDAMFRAVDRAEELAEELQDATMTRLSAAVTATRKAGATMAADLAERASDTAEYARDMALERADAAKAAVSEAGTRIADGFRAAADATEGLPARSLAAVAGGVSTVATSLSGESLSSLAAQTRDFARRNPVTFMVGTAVIGFALVRLFKSSSRAAEAAAPTPQKSATRASTAASKPATRTATRTTVKAGTKAKTPSRPAAKTGKAANRAEQTRAEQP